MKPHLKFNPWLLPVALAGSLLLADGQPGLAAPSYQVFDLHPLGSKQSVAHDINNSGAIVGDQVTADGRRHGAFWSSSSSPAAALRTFGDTASSASGINSSNQIVGNAVNSYVLLRLAAFWNDSSSFALNLNDLGGDGSEALDINDSGEIVGYAYNAGAVQRRHATYWTNSSSQVKDLGTLPGVDPSTAYGTAYAINNSGQIAGLASITADVTRAAFWADSSSPAKNLGALGSESSWAMGIDGAGRIVGATSLADPLSPFHAAVWNSPSIGGLHYLDTLDDYHTEAWDINSDGQIVGTAFRRTPWFSTERAVLWDRGSSQVTDLNSRIPANSGWVLNAAHAINDNGVIVGEGTILGERHAFALVPDYRRPFIEFWNHDAILNWPLGCIACGYFFTVQTTTDLVSSAWSTIASNLVGTSTIMTNIHYGGADGPQRFYRVLAHIPNLLAATDDASSAAYTNGWPNNSNDGMGFGPWTLRTTSTNETLNGFFIGSSSNNASGESLGIDVGGESWGLYANSGNLAVAYRAFSNPLQVGGTFGIHMDNGYIDGGSAVGFVLRHGNASAYATNYTTGSRFQFLFTGMDYFYAVIDATGTHYVGLPLTGTGLRVVFTLTGTNTYRLQTIDYASGGTNTLTGTLAGSGSLDSVALFNKNAGTSPANDAFFNLMQIGSP
jgi:probable HAF family extracellular repeat protein